jgi:hypothetical protein
VIICAVNYKIMADKMYYPPKAKRRTPPTVNESTASSLVIVVERFGVARAYPIDPIGHHGPQALNRSLAVASSRASSKGFAIN